MSFVLVDLIVTTVPQAASKDAPPPWIQMRQQQLQKTASEELVQELKKTQAKEQADLTVGVASDPLEMQFSNAVQHAMDSCTKDSIAVRMRVSFNLDRELV